MTDFPSKVEALADLMDEFQLSKARLAGDDWEISFSRSTKTVSIVETVEAPSGQTAHRPVAGGAAPPVQEQVLGTPVSSPMTGIFYTSPSPSAPAFVKPGDVVTAGAVVGLIEAMKVFNEIVAPVSGRVDRVLASSGDLVQPGEPLLYIV